MKLLTTCPTKGKKGEGEGQQTHIQSSLDNNHTLFNPSDKRHRNKTIQLLSVNASKLIDKHVTLDIHYIIYIIMVVTFTEY
jgi:hypothetical protein